MLKIKNYSNNEVFYATKHSAGFDISSSEVRLIPSRQWRLVSTGLYIQEWEPLRLVVETPDARGYNLTGTVELIPQLQILPRSGLALKTGVTVLNAPGLIDVDFTLEIMVLLINHGEHPYTVEKGDRIAQGVMSYVEKVKNVEVKQVDRYNGFGSSGI